jgi:fatty acid desaturase
MAMAYATPSDKSAYSLDGSTDVILAPVRGTDTRRDLPRGLFHKYPAFFTARLLCALAIIFASWTAVALVRTWPVISLAVIVLGAMYAHLVELQHECLHEHAYNRRWLNRLIGFICGVPMMSSFSHYKYDHLRHHAFLGTPQNREFFNYRFQALGSPLGFVRACFHLGRYIDVLKNVSRSLTGRLNPLVTKTVSARKIRAEYIAFAIILAAAIVAGVITHSLVPVFIWLLPVILVAEPVHFLIELPEHFGLNTQTDPNVLTNTRSVRAGWFAVWFTNGNNMHTAHHFHQGVPMIQVFKLHKIIQDRIEFFAPSYWSFYKKVLTGKISHADRSETCMTR